MISERWDFPPEGLRGGRPGGRAGATRTAPSDRALPEKGRTVLDPGDVIRLVTAGGGGFGNPEKRDADRVAEDLHNDLISEDAAREVYGLERRGGP